MDGLPFPRLPQSLVILVVDDNPFNREGVRLYLERQGMTVLEAGDAASAWQLAVAHQPAAAVIDIVIPPTVGAPFDNGQSLGIELTRRLKSTFPALGVVLFSAHEDRGRELWELVHDNMRGLAYKLKGGPPAGILHALADVLAGRVLFDPEVVSSQRGLVDELWRIVSPVERPWLERAVARLPELTDRERDVAYRLAASHNTRGIAAALDIAPKTAETYVTRIYEKLGLSEMAEQAVHLRKVVVLAKAFLIAEMTEPS